MKIESFKRKGVKPAGTFENNIEAIETRGAIIMNSSGGGCGLTGCHCSDGYWLSVVKPRTEDGIVEGLKVKFEDESEMEHFFSVLELNELSSKKI